MAATEDIKIVYVTPETDPDSEIQPVTLTVTHTRTLADVKAAVASKYGVDAEDYVYSSMMTGFGAATDDSKHMHSIVCVVAKAMSEEYMVVYNYAGVGRLVPLSQVTTAADLRDLVDEAKWFGGGARFYASGKKLMGEEILSEIGVVHGVGVNVQPVYRGDDETTEEKKEEPTTRCFFVPADADVDTEVRYVKLPCGDGTLRSVKAAVAEKWGVDAGEFVFTSIPTGLEPQTDDEVEFKFTFTAMSRDLEGDYVLVQHLAGLGRLVSLDSFNTIGELVDLVDDAKWFEGGARFNIMGKVLAHHLTKEELGLVHGCGLACVPMLRG